MLSFSDQLVEGEFSNPALGLNREFMRTDKQE